MQQILDRLLLAWNERAWALKAISFAAIGVFNALVDLSVFLTAYHVFSLPLVPCNVLAWIVAVSFSYVMNTYITFGPESGRKLRFPVYFTFVLSGVAGMVATTVTLVILANFLDVLVAKLLSILVSFVVNFSLSHFIVFRKRPAA
ncbi:MAG TPA: GtrA family protein [Xanthobacteraceae bacterium]|nr:GtrA family protein [Xanthobacteraceae bacterium]